VKLVLYEAVNLVCVSESVMNSAVGRGKMSDSWFPQRFTLLKRRGMSFRIH